MVKLDKIWYPRRVEKRLKMRSWFKFKEIEDA